MTGKTHRAGGALMAMVGFSMLKNRGLLFDNINPLLQFAVIYPFAYWGSTVSDLDHVPESIPSHDIVSKTINKILHITAPIDNGKRKLAGIFNAKHRSWQTHSIEVFLALLYLLYKILNGELFGSLTANMMLATLILQGITLGVLSHLILDLITPSGIVIATTYISNRLVNSKLPEKIKLLPQSSFFATGGAWETLIYNLLSITNTLYLMFIVCKYLNIIPITISIY